MALPGTIGDPLKPIKDKLNDIERAVDKLSKDNAKDNSEEITEIKESIQSISKLLKNIVDGMETDEVRLQNRTEMESHITQSVNDNINTQMSNIKNDLKQTKFSVTLKEDQLQIFREFLKALSPEAWSEFGEFLDKHVKHLNDVATTVSKENLQQSLSDSSKEWVKSYKDTLKKEVENAYNEVEKKRKQEGKVIVMQTYTFYVFLAIVMYSTCFGFWGMIQVIAPETLRWCSIAILAGGLFSSCIWSWMKFKNWRYNQKYRY